MEPALDVAFEGLGCKQAEVGGAACGPWLAGQSGDGRLKDATGQQQRGRGEDAAASLFVTPANQAIGLRLEPRIVGAEGVAARPCNG